MHFFESVIRFFTCVPSATFAWLERDHLWHAVRLWVYNGRSQRNDGILSDHYGTDKRHNNVLHNADCLARSAAVSHGNCRKSLHSLLLSAEPRLNLATADDHRRHAHPRGRRRPARNRLSRRNLDNQSPEVLRSDYNSARGASLPLTDVYGKRTTFYVGRYLLRPGVVRGHLRTEC